MSRGRNGAAGAAKGARRATVAAPAAVLGGKGRWSARRKMTVVLELRLRGAELEATSRKYGVGGRLPRSTYYARRHRLNHPVESRKRGPRTAWTDEVLTERIREQIAASPFSGEGHRKVWA